MEKYAKFFYLLDMDTLAFYLNHFVNNCSATF